MAVIANLNARNSHALLENPGPDAEQLQAILKAGLRAPDHARLRPWQFVVVEGERREGLGEVFVEALKLSRPEATEAELDRARAAPLRAPLIIAGLLKPVEHEKVPRVEQVCAVATALYGMQLAADELGFGSIWRTGNYARDPLVVHELGGDPAGEVVGFLYIGTRKGPSKPLAELDPSDFVAYF